MTDTRVESSLPAGTSGVAPLQRPQNIQAEDASIAERAAFQSRPELITPDSNPLKDFVNEEIRHPCPRCGSSLHTSRIYKIAQHNPRGAVKPDYTAPISEIYYEICVAGDFRRQLLLVKKIGGNKVDWTLGKRGKGMSG